jgi:formylmethanofuran dehydrogenase subunit E
MRYKRQRHLTYKEAVRFHGHDGPFLALGYRLGIFLVKELKPEGIMGLRITVKTKIKKPYTCVLDGLQCSTFATCGKGNLMTKSHGKQDILVSAKRTRKTVKYRMSPYAWDVCLHADDLHKAGEGNAPS